MVLTANKEAVKKELFKTLLVRIFKDDKEINELIDNMSLGAEKTIMNIPLRKGSKTGAADTQYNKVIIEFENNLKRTGEHAIEQLSEYLAGNWKSGNNYNFTLIATDCVIWKIYTPKTESVLFDVDNFVSSDLILEETDSIELNENNLDDFPYFLDRYLFKTEIQKATLKNITRDFGDKSQIFFSCVGLMKLKYLDSKDPDLIVAYENWQKFLAIAYGKYKGSKEVFFVHTYLSVLSKILAYSIISGDTYIDFKELKEIVRGTIFDKYHVRNFVDDDFFHWVSTKENYLILKSIFRAITQQIDRYDFRDVNEDILKGIYQELIDLETRHDLGEYYTPDWLCQKIVEQFDFKLEDKILDPACGSGSFLLAIINNIKKKYPKLTAREITSRVVGIDIHPLSVQISKTTILIALGKSLQTLREPISLRVYLANTLIIPDESVELFKNMYRMVIDKNQYEVDSTIFNDPTLFDNATSICNELADYTKDSKTLTITEFAKIFEKKNLLNMLDEIQLESFYKIYQGFKTAKESGRDNIWKFILQNLYKPFFLKEQFDYVIGNPPWITYADFSNSSYQNTLFELAAKYFLLPKSKKDMPHLEIASIFLSYCASYFLKKGGGSISFVLPRSFLNGSQHDNTRSGRSAGFKINEIWDLEGVTPLFRIPSCVFFVNKHNWKIHESRQIPKTGISGFNVIGRLSNNNPAYDEIDKLKFEKVKWYYSIIGEISALTNKKIDFSTKGNYYELQFKQGATIVPRSFYFIEPEQHIPNDFKNRIVQVKTSEIIIEDAKKPWKDFANKGRINSNYLFKTTLSKNILPFSLVNPPLVLLPIKIDVKNGIKKIELLQINNILNNGDIETAKWFKKNEKYWKDNRTELNNEMNSFEYLNWLNKLIDQNLNYQYLVLYTASSKDANAVVVDRESYNYEIIVESKAYWFATNDLNEANYITCFLNCSYTNEVIKDFQSRGLFGARDMHKKILEIPFSKYNENNSDHKLLANIGKICHEKVNRFVHKNNVTDLKTRELGSMRLEIRKLLKKEIEEMNLIVKKIVQL